MNEFHDLYEKAKEDESCRQYFLDCIMDKGLPKHVKKLIYKPMQKYGNNDLESFIFMDVKYHPLTKLLIKGTKSTINVYPASFDFSLSPQIRDWDAKCDDFFSLLEDHEYFHAKEFYECPKNISVPAHKKYELIGRAISQNGFDNCVDQIKKFKLKAELRAYKNQIDNFPNRDCSPQFQALVNIIALDTIKKIKEE